MYLLTLPTCAEKRMAVRVTAVAERALRSGHPWLFASGVESVSFEGNAGDLAVVFDGKRRFLAVGLYDPHSPIRVRILQHGEPATIDAAWFERKIAAAAAIRAYLPAAGTTGYRLVHGENDGLPGLIVDRYGETLVLKLYTAAWLPHLRAVVAAATAVAHPQRIVLRLSREMQKQELYGLFDGMVLAGEPLAGDMQFCENGLLLAVDVVQGQKTGFFLDQRENRARVEGLAQGKSVLNVFAYTGGFSLYAARGGAREVVSLDLSEPALATAVHNFVLNQITTPHETLVGDAFQVMSELAANGRLFDMVIIDPPSFAKKQSEVAGALGAYGRLVRLGLELLQPGGILVMASCSSRIAAAAFFELVHKTAREGGRPLREIERTEHALDHPITFKEGAYLKCLFATA
ncbi:MAG: class I SAM-dependent methyltransferase [Ardenticatenaceae bacterium]|nr:class I SAM-dependent methyltransferase [Ardenticatenaceae bacterium]